MNILLSELQNSSEKELIKHRIAVYFCGGRINLIGEHLDYNGGLVMPIALNIGIKALFRKRDDGKVTLTSSNFSSMFSSSEFIFEKSNSAEWYEYVLGGIHSISSSYNLKQGFDIHFSSNLPIGSGLSSSAAIEVLTAFLLQNEFDAGKTCSRQDIALLCQKVENDFIGVKCGIMDQFAVSNGLKNHAMLLNCEQLTCEQIPFELDDYQLLILNTKKPRHLIDSAYNTRKHECETALEILKSRNTNLSVLAHAEMEDLAIIHDEKIKKRARHVVTENLRVKQSALALRNGDLHTFGKLMNASHHSLKHDYEVTGNELDCIVSAAQNEAGCIGSRMTGAGFGGCAIALVHEKNVSGFIENVSKKYFAVTNIQAEIYVAESGKGVYQLL